MTLTKHHWTSGYIRRSRADIVENSGQDEHGIALRNLQNGFTSPCWPFLCSQARINPLSMDSASTPSSERDQAAMMIRKLMTLILVAMSGLFASTAPAGPNIVIFLADDAGWGGYSHSGNRQVSTPHIDSIAQRGVTLDRFYVCPVCSPTRAEFLTGRYHPHGGVWGTSLGQERLDLDEHTFDRWPSDLAIGSWELCRHHGSASGTAGRSSDHPRTGPRSCQDSSGIAFDPTAVPGT